MTHKITLTKGTKTYEHLIAIDGTAGAIFFAIVAALVIFVIGYSTNGWNIVSGKDGGAYMGLWQVCGCSSYHGDDRIKATQAMATIALILLVCAFLLICMYMFVHNTCMQQKNLVLILTMILSLASCVFMLIAVMVWGTDELTKHNLHFSFAFVCIAAIAAAFAGVMAIVQMSRANICR